MTTLRQARWLRTFLYLRDAWALPAAMVAGCGLLVPAAMAAAPHAHARRPLPTPLHVTSVTETRRRGTGGVAGHAGTSKAKAGARASAATGTHGSAKAAPHGSSYGTKKGKGRRTVEPVADPVPMFRARRGAAPLDRSDRSDRHGVTVAHMSRNGRGEGGWSRGPAPLASELRGRRGSRVVVAESGHYASSFSVKPAHASGRGSTAVASQPSYPERTYSGPPDRNVADVVPLPRPYAEGVARPTEDDESLPTRRSVAGASGSSVVITRPAAAKVSAAPPATPSPVTQPPVVQGFGSEVAVPAPDGADRSGQTRRRNHPSNWTPESLVTAPEPLEEREAITEAAVSPAVLPQLYDRDGRLVMPAPMRGSHDILVHQNLMATTDGLERIQDDADLLRMRTAHLLVSFPVSESLRLNEDLPENRRVARPWTVAFAADMGRAFYAHFRQPIQVNSAVRTVRYQARLQMVNGNAAATYGDGASPHLTGQAIDIAKRWMTHEQIAWVRGYLAPWMQAGKIDVEEEFQQACFHISVYRSYAATRRATQHQVAQVQPNAQVPSAKVEPGGADPETETNR